MLDNIVKLLNEAKVVILPTDTVYGLHADALNIEAIKKVDDIKNSDKPHLMLISNNNMLNLYTKNITELHRKLIEKYWPGELTILFEKSSLIPNELTKNSELVGIRMPNNELLLSIINKFNKPILSTSANITNESVITSIDLLDGRIKDKVSYIYDGGILDNTVSTLIKIEEGRIVFLRDGDLSKQIKSDFKDYL